MKKILAGTLVFLSTFAMTYADLSPKTISKLDSIVMKINELEPLKKAMVTSKLSMKLEKTDSDKKMMVYKYVLENIDTSDISYDMYSQDKLSSDKTNVLFFHATWCGKCKKADKNLKKEMASFPADLQVLKVDYDSNQDLRTKYGVTSQHTFVVVDENGEMLSKFSWASDLKDILEEIN